MHSSLDFLELRGRGLCSEQVEISHLQAAASRRGERAAHSSAQPQVLQEDEIHQLVQYLDHEGRCFEA